MSNKIIGYDKSGIPLSYITQEEMDECVRIQKERRELRNKARRDRDQVMRDMGLKKVRGNLGGTYWE